MKFANPAPLGLFGYALSTWLLSMINAGFLASGSLAMVLTLAFTYGGTAQFVAGVIEMARGNTFPAIAFCSYGAFWWSFALFGAFYHSVPSAAVGSYLLMWGVFTLVLWVCTFKLNWALVGIFTPLWISYGLLGFHYLFNISALQAVGGYFGMMTAFAAAYFAAANLINEVYGKTILPIGDLS